MLYHRSFTLDISFLFEPRPSFGLALKKVLDKRRSTAFCEKKSLKFGSFMGNSVSERCNERSKVRTNSKLYSNSLFDFYCKKTKDFIRKIYSQFV